MFTAGMMLFIQFVLMIVTVYRVPTLQYNGTPLPSRLTSRDRRARRNFMRLSVTLTTYSLISWLPELMLSFVLRSGDSTVQAQQSVIITSDLFMCVLYISPSILPLLISCSLIRTHHRFDFGFSYETYEKLPDCWRVMILHHFEFERTSFPRYWHQVQWIRE